MPEKLRIDRYQQLIAWQSAGALAAVVESMVSSGPPKSDPEFCKQIRKSTAKAPAQIAEGFGRFTAKESAYYYRIARASLAETQNHLNTGRRRKYWDAAAFKKAWDLSETALKTTTGLLRSMLEQIAQEERSKRAASRHPRPEPEPKS